ncbi:unnamed protein product [Darwinula stevensoni]|uniref:FAS1 domain-containing protein n=1 Tax=Darwinula stevensoni TaxID=69355 RepID=A0A7R8WY76_9CRUS|nr:unnamed protein product [Darwinula stevensoni]CAG0878686.1 unnamed protein product [Darwinula stevensoni]
MRKVLRDMLSLYLTGALLLLGNAAAGIVDHNVIVHRGDRMNLLDLAQSLNLTVFVEAMEKTHLDNTIDHEGPYTLFSPLNIAFENIPDYTKEYSLGDLMKLHVARGDYLEKELKDEQLIRSLLSKRDVRINIYKKKSGKLITANGQKLNETDFDAHNGVLHIIDGVMNSIYAREGTALKEVSSGALPYYSFNTLSRAVKSSDVVTSLLDGSGPLTLFAPSDKAFSRLPDSVNDYLLKNKTALEYVLKYHAISGRTWFTIGLEDNMNLQTAATIPLTVSIKQDGVKVGDAKVVLPDFCVANGVVHIIDNVLLPPGFPQF